MPKPVHVFFNYCISYYMKYYCNIGLHQRKSKEIDVTINKIAKLSELSFAYSIQKSNSKIISSFYRSYDPRYCSQLRAVKKRFTSRGDRFA